jgi:hypothetical protein
MKEVSLIKRKETSPFICCLCACVCVCPSHERTQHMGWKGDGEGWMKESS